MTFDELAGALAVRAHGRSALSRRYRAFMRGIADAEWVPAAPVVRRQIDGELTKFAQPTAAGFEVESVIIPMARFGRSWQALCVSSQVGCALGCTFCETAQLGLRQDLSAGEIVGQVVAAQRDFGAAVRKVVFMGMGEPLDNFDEVTRAIRVLCDQRGLQLSKERITLSTVGRIGGIRRLASLGWRRLNLAVSLNAPGDEIRSRIMPVNRAEPMGELRDALLDYARHSDQYIMIEYVLIPGVNDAPAHAAQLADYCRPLRCCVNVIPYNPRLDSPWPAPGERSVAAFVEALRAAGQYATRRVTKGRDLMAACGQLGNRRFARRPAAALDAATLDAATPDVVALRSAAPRRATLGGGG